MADTRDPGIAGPNPVETRPVKVDMGMGPSPTARPHPEPPAARGGGGAGTVFLSALISLACGAGGAWAYERFLSHSSGPQPAEKAPATNRDPGTHKELAGLEDRVKDLSERGTQLADEYRQLRARVEALPSTAAPTDLGALEGKAAQVDQLARRVEAIGDRVDPLPGRFEQVDRRLAQLDEKLNGLHGQPTAAIDRASGRDRRVSLTRDDRPSPSARTDRTEASEPASSSPATATDAAAIPPADADGAGGNPDGAAIGDGEALFRQGKYSEAYAAFRKRLVAQSEDARVWYFAALSYGLATGDWGRMTETMAEEGVAREKAGKPARPEIDSAFNGLTKQTGKDWLAFYRRRAG